MDFKFDYVFIKLKKAKPDYAANLDSIEELISTNMEAGSYKEAQKFNEIYKNIVPDKHKYYENAYIISIKLEDKMSAILSLIEEIETTDNFDITKDNISKIKEIYKETLKRRQYSKLNRKLTKSYKYFLRKKINKDKFIEDLKNLIIEYSLD
jgi:CRISPR/Cas system-associated endoribonuclease Cas2